MSITTAAIRQGFQALAAVCPAAPPGMQTYQDQVIGWIKWGVIALIIATALVSIGAIGVGKIFAMPHASKVGVISIVVVFLAAIAYMVVPGMISGITGSGCV